VSYLPFDGLVLHKVLKEIKDNIVGDRIKNIYQPIKSQVLIQFSQSFVLLSLKSPSYVILLSQKPNVPIQPANFSQFLRKKIRNGRVVNVEQLGLDRIGYFEIESYDQETSTLRQYKLFFELMGRNSNVTLVNEDNKVEESLKRIYDEFRPIIPGVKYIPYYDDSQTSILRENIENEENIDYDRLMGFSKKSKEFLKEIGIQRAVQDLKKPHLYYFNEANTYDFSAITPNNFEYEELKPSEALLKVFQEKADQSRLLEIKKDLEKRVKNEIDRLEKTKEQILQDLNEEKSLTDLEKKGELLQTYLYKIKKGERYFTVTDWNTGEEVTIEIDPLLSPTQNLEKLYKNIKRTKSKVEYAKKRIKKVNNELEYFNQLFETISSAEEIETLIEIKEEMKDIGLISENKKSKRERKVKTTFRKFNYKGFEILVGKNNKQNDELTRSAAQADIWLHTHEIPGSHTIIKSSGKEIPEEVIDYAARIAATFSKAKMSSNVAVDYTQRKNVWKPKGAKPGMWLYRNYDTIIVEPFREL
jgi:predicted ribosome quality control (RQC) complex YloA/Tae2 family protein